MKEQDGVLKKKKQIRSRYTRSSQTILNVSTHNLCSFSFSLVFIPALLFSRAPRFPTLSFRVASVETQVHYFILPFFGKPWAFHHNFCVYDKIGSNHEKQGSREHTSSLARSRSPSRARACTELRGRERDRRSRRG